MQYTRIIDIHAHSALSDPTVAERLIPEAARHGVKTMVLLGDVGVFGEFPTEDEVRRILADPTGEITRSDIRTGWFEKDPLKPAVLADGNFLSSSDPGATRPIDVFRVYIGVPVEPVAGPLPNEVDGGERLSGDLEFRDLAFSYVGGRPILSGVSFGVPAGTTVALVGRTGAGKSTILSLLLRIDEPPAGTIFIGGRDVTSLPLPVLRRNVAVVPQEMPDRRDRTVRFEGVSFLYWAY